MAAFLLKEQLQPGDQRWLKNVLHGVRLSVHTRGRHVGMRHQVKLPEPMIVDKPFCFNQSTLGQLDLTVRSTPHQPLGLTPLNLPLQLPQRPRPQLLKFDQASRCWASCAGMASEFGFAEFINSPQQVLSIYG